MKRQILILSIFLSISQCHSMQQSSSFNPISALRPSYEIIFLLGEKLTPTNVKQWNDNIGKIKDFIIKNSNNDKNLINAWKIVENLSIQIIDRLDYIRNITGILSKEEKQQY